MKVLFVTKDLSDNSTGRTYSLWLLVQKIGWSSRIVSSAGGEIWKPLQDTDFADQCVRLTPNSPDWDEAARQCDVIVSVKPVLGAFDIASLLAVRHGKPLLLDIDDPDLDAILGIGNPVKALAKSVLRARTYWPTRKLRRMIKDYPILVSNPHLQSQYGGTVVPHVRTDSGIGALHGSSEPRVAFVGTNRGHKGISTLRNAVARVAHLGVKLEITDYPPRDRLAHEQWTGPSSLTAGIELVKRSDIVVIPSVGRNRYAAGQLPVKLVDAMMAGRAVVVSDLPPLQWAVGDAGLVFRADDDLDLARQIERLTDPKYRQELGERARTRALRLFSTDTVAHSFERAVLEAMADFE